MTALTGVAGWLLTYLIHSTLLLGAVALATHWFVRREAVREALWRGAMIGGIVTATLATALPRPGQATIRLAALEPWGSVVEDQAGTEWPGQERAAGADSEAGGEGAVDSESETGAVPWQPAVDAGRPAADSGTPGGVAGGSGAGSPDGEPASAGLWMAVVVGIWAVVAVALLLRLAYRHVRLRVLLRDRSQVPGGEPAVATLTELRRVAGVWKPVRLTSTPAVGTPLALGGAEVCVPERFLTELGPGEQRAALAHELAHLARRDPFWQVMASVIGAVFFFQPLNGLARRRIRAAAEYLADGWAVAHTGSQIELARCLAAVAGWVAPNREPALAGTVAMAEGGSPLMSRVSRLLEREPERATRPLAQLAIALGLVALTAAFAPAVGPGAGEAPGAVGPAWAPDGGPDEPASSDQEPLDVRRFDGPGLEGESFVARLNEAGRDARQSPYWVAYAVPAVKGGRDLLTDSEAWNVLELDGPSVARTLGVEAELVSEHVLMLVRLEPEGAATRVRRVTARRPDLGMRIGGVVYWLGEAGPEESFRWLRDIYTASRDPDIRETAVDAIGMHATAEAEPFLRAVLERDKAQGVREEAIEGLVEQRPDTAMARLMFNVALNDPDAGVRTEAAEQLGRIPEPLAVELLVRLAWESETEDVQRQAAESLGEHRGDDARAALDRLIADHPSGRVRREALDQLVDMDGFDGETLLGIALSADDPDVRGEAVEKMAELPSDEAVAYLRRAVFESGDGTVERQAAESAGEVGTRPALDLLLEILERTPSEDAAFQAVEALAENFPEDTVLPVLREILTTHPSARVRREALDHLSDMGG